MKHEYYVSPESEVIWLPAEDCICASPYPGGSEDIGYVNWN